MAYQDYCFEHSLLDNQKVIRIIDQAIEKKVGFSLARFGIGEITYLSWPANPLLLEQFKRYESYAGVTCSPEIIKNELVTALRTVDMAGLITPQRLDFWAKTTRLVLEQMAFLPSNICCAWIMHDLVHEGKLWRWLNKKRVFLVGRRSHEAYSLFKKQGVHVTGFLQLNHFDEIDIVHDNVLKDSEWEIVLISAGIPATILAPRIAKSSGRVAIDFGHALDLIIDGKSFDHSMLVKKWNDQDFLSKENEI